jgi:hypothetical protein
MTTKRTLLTKDSVKGSSEEITTLASEVLRKVARASPRAPLMLPPPLPTALSRPLVGLALLRLACELLLGLEEASSEGAGDRAAT